MREKIINAIIKLQRIKKANAVIPFSHRSKIGTKSFSANVQYHANQTPIVVLLKNNGYNEKYLKAKLYSDFKSILEAPLPNVQSGDSILVRSVGNSSQPGDQVTLDKFTYYYSVNGGIVFCDGRQLGKAFQASFIRPDQSSCAAGGAIMDYYEFKLL